MERNEGWPDRITRFVAGVMLLGLYGALAVPWKYLTLTGLVLIATAMTGYCPLYSLAGFKTCKTKEGAHP
jgi:Inner membrane protein YgaP-like, transmembrane domain